MPSLTDVRDAACAHLKARLPRVARVEAFAGELDLRSAAPKGLGYDDSVNLFLAVGEAENAAPQGSLDFDMEASFAAFAVARHATRPTAAEALALDVVQRAALELHGATFGLPGLSPARVVSLAPVPDDDLAKRGLWIWSLTWQQRVVFTDSDSGATPPAAPAGGSHDAD